MAHDMRFTYEQFKQLEGLDLVSYMEPIIIDASTNIPEDELTRMLGDLSSYDEFHLVYAIELGGKHLPAAFAAELCKYLLDDRGAVWSAAYRALMNLPDSCISRDLLTCLAQLNMQHSGKPCVGEVLAVLEKRQRT